jgi:hypothetical protein
MNQSPNPNKKTITDHDIENMIETEHTKIKADAYNDGKHDGMKEPAQPLAKNDKLVHHIHFKSKYESLALKVLKIIQPASQLAEGRKYKELADAKSKIIADEIIGLEKNISILKQELDKYDPSHIASRIRTTHIIGASLFIGEVALNTAAFQVTGDNLISCLTLAASVSLAVCFGAHFAGRKFKDAKTIFEKRLIIFTSAIGMGIVSAVIASLRTSYLHRIGVEVNPIYFTVFNFVFFLIAAFATWYYYPNKEEIEQNKESLQKLKFLKKFEKEKQEKQDELHEHEKVKNETLGQYTRAVMEAEYAIERIKIMYRESIAEYQKGNRMGRKDFPECFNDEIPELNLPDINFQSIITKYKTNENNNPDSAL